MGFSTSLRILAAATSNNNITNCNILDSSLWDFYSLSGPVNNTVSDTHINKTKVSFTGVDIAMKSVISPPADPAGAYNIGKYLNTTNNSANSWMHLNISYTSGDLNDVDESTLKMYKYSGTAWELVPGINGVNTLEDYVYANITSSNFSIFAPLGVAKCTDGTQYGQCSATKPLYCDAGTLVSKCSVCGCPSGQSCQGDGTCTTPTAVGGGGGAAPTPTPTPTPTPILTPTPKPLIPRIPGFEAIFAIIGLLAVAYLIFRQREE